MGQGQATSSVYGGGSAQSAGGSPAYSPPPLMPSPSPAASGVPSSGSSSDSCSGAYQQCGGKIWQGPNCCQSGCQCSGGEYYKQCHPPAGLTTCGSSGLVGPITPQQPQQPQQPRQQQCGLAVGDRVTWIGEDEDVPAGT